MNISLRQIRYFIAAAEAGQMSMAAKELNVSQSAVTIAIRQLETTLGVSLFDRTGRVRGWRCECWRRCVPRLGPEACGS